MVAVFQPHLYTRTRDFADDFGRALRAADRVWTTEIYAAREDPIRGVNGKLIADKVGGGDSQYAPSLEALSEALMGDVAPGDLLVVMGAGDVDRVAFEVFEGLQRQDN
jgi:UDP-N-acetylmuramate--alanine ligase